MDNFAQDILELADIFYKTAKAKNPAEYQRNRYHAKRNALIEELGGKCKKCGSKDNLHVDHINRKKKKYRVADIASVSDAAFAKEKPNLQLLCEDCHKAKTREAWDYGMPKAKHGTYHMYKKYKCRCKKCVKAYKEAKKIENQLYREKKKNEKGEVAELENKLEKLKDVD